MKKNFYFASFLFCPYLIACGGSQQTDFDEGNKIIVENFFSRYPLAIKLSQDVKEKEVVRIFQKKCVKYLNDNSSTLGDEKEKTQEIENLFNFITHDTDSTYFPLTREKILNRINNFTSFKKILEDITHLECLKELNERKKFIVSFAIYDHCQSTATIYERKKQKIFENIESLKIENEETNDLIEQKIKKALNGKENV